MRPILRVLSLCLAVLMLCGCSKTAPTAQAATEAPDSVIVTVNGDAVMRSNFEPYYQRYLTNYTMAGMEIQDEQALAYLEDAALTECIQDVIMTQDMVAQGCYDFDTDTTAWMEEAGKKAYAEALKEVEEYLRYTLGESDTADMSQAAATYAEAAGVSEDSYIQVFKDEYAAVLYYNWLLKDCPVTEEDIQAAYEAGVADGKARFENDIQAFEAAIAANEAVWYQPSGYRSVLQILLNAEGETDEEKLASVADTVEAIYARLDAGEAFETLIAEYGADISFADESFYETGYSVHRDSVIWDEAFIAAAFSDDLSAPGTWSKTPMVSESGVHILYYLRDAEGGPAPYNDTVREALNYSLYQSRVAQRWAERQEELSQTAEVVYPE